MLAILIGWPVSIVFLGGMFWCCCAINRDEPDSEDEDFLDRIGKRKDAA